MDAATSTSFVEDYAVVAGQFASQIASADLRAPVAACPGWTTYDLVTHLGNVHAWAATIVETGRPAPKQNDEPRSRRSRAVHEWYVAKAEDLFQVLKHTSATRPCWNFALGEGTAQFWQRRQMHETTVHLVDLALTTGQHVKVPAAGAADGVDEVLTVMVPRMHRKGRFAALSAALRITASDTGDVWLVRPARPHLPQVPTQPRGPAAAPGGGSPVPVVRRLRRSSPARLRLVEGSGGRPSTDSGPALSEAGRRDDPCPEAADRGGSGLEEDAVSAPAEVLYRALWHREVQPTAMELHGDADRVARFLASPLVP